jgi:hypothetical protein
MRLLEKAATLDDYGTFHQGALQAQIDAYQKAGRSEEGARTRVYLSDNGTVGDIALIRLDDSLGIKQNRDAAIGGNEEVVGRRSQSGIDHADPTRRRNCSVHMGQGSAARHFSIGSIQAAGLCKEHLDRDDQQIKRIQENHINPDQPKDQIT